MQSSLAKYQPITPKTAEEMQRYCERLWHEKNMILVDLNSIGDTYVHTYLTQRADRLYGKANNAKKPRHNTAP